MQTWKTYRRRIGRVLGCVALLLGLLLAVPAVAGEPEPFDEAVAELFAAGFLGDEEALERGLALVEEKLTADPDHPGAPGLASDALECSVGHGLCAGRPGDGRALFDRSLAQFDRAVSLAPESLQTRVPRASVLLSVARYTPDASARARYLETSLEDYMKILELRAPEFDTLTVDSRGELLGGLAEVLWRLERHDDAKVYLRRMIAELPESPVRGHGARTARRSGHACGADLLRL